MGYLINIDVGGTHTDGVLFTPDGEPVQGKVPSTPEDITAAVLDSIALLADQIDESTESMLADTDLVAHGTTVGTNAL
jgi:N-methylhydantoinase A